MAVASPPYGPVVFVGTARNCDAFLPSALQRWSLLAPLFREAHFLVAENDSTDHTKRVLHDWAEAGPNRRVLSLDGLTSTIPDRSTRLAAVRNRLLHEIRSCRTLSSAAFLIVMDLDDASLAITPGCLKRSMALESWDALFANQLFYFYDVWALRAKRCPDDWAEKVEQAPAGWRRRIAVLRYLTWRGRPIWPVITRPIEVRSAFGGFAIYRLPVALMSEYVGWRNDRPICEHVPFNERLSDMGALLMIHPDLINMVPRFLYRLNWL